MLFDGAGGLLLALNPLKHPEKQAVEAGADKIGYKAEYYWHTWAGGLAAKAQLTADLLTKKPGDKFVVIGYSWGGRAARDFAVLNSISTKWDLVFTIDPVNGIPGPGFVFDLPGGEDSWKKRWVNYFEKVDTASLLGGLPIRGTKIVGADNKELNAADFAKKEFYLDDAIFPKATAYPDGKLFTKNVTHAHLDTPYYKPLLDDLQKRIEELK